MEIKIISPTYSQYFTINTQENNPILILIHINKFQNKNSVTTDDFPLNNDFQVFYGNF